MTPNLAPLFLLDPEITFLNHGSYGACPAPVFAEYQRWQRQLECQPVAFLDPTRGLSAQLRAGRQALAAEHGADEQDLVAVTNATQGLNIVAASLDLRMGDEILTTDHEYGALEKTWAHICQKTGAKVVTIKVPLPMTSELAYTETLLAGFTTRTRVLFLSHITSATALLFPIESAVATARARGIFTVIDGAHTPGHIPLNLNALGADFYAGNCHKWLMAPKGSAFLHVRPELQHLVQPGVISHGWSLDPDANGAFGNSRFIDMLEMQGTRDPAAFLTVPAALEFRAQHNWPGVARACRDLVQDTARHIRALTGLPALSTPEFCAPQMVAMPVPKCDPKRLQQALMQHYSIEIPCFNWQDHTIVRVSAQGYNTQKDMDRLVMALTKLLPELCTDG